MIQNVHSQLIHIYLGYVLLIAYRSILSFVSESAPIKLLVYTHYGIQMYVSSAVKKQLRGILCDRSFISDIFAQTSLFRLALGLFSLDGFFFLQPDAVDGRSTWHEIARPQVHGKDFSNFISIYSV